MEFLLYFAYLCVELFVLLYWHVVLCTNMNQYHVHYLFFVLVLAFMLASLVLAHSTESSFIHLQNVWFKSKFLLIFTGLIRS